VKKDISKNLQETKTLSQARYAIKFSSLLSETQTKGL